MGIETLAIASLGASIIGGGIQAMGAMQSGQASMQAAQYRAGVAQRMASSTLDQGGSEAQRYGYKVGQLKGTQRANYAASGVRTDWGSAADVAQSTDMIGRLDEATIMYNAALKAAGLEEQGQLHLMEGESRRSEANTRALGSVLGTATSVSDRWMNFSRAGVFG